MWHRYLHTKQQRADSTGGGIPHAAHTDRGHCPVQSLTHQENFREGLDTFHTPKEHFGETAELYHVQYLLLSPF